MPPKAPLSAASSVFRATARPSSTQCIYHNCHPTRTFSGSASLQKMTRRRRKLFEWLRGPGEAFRQPLEGSTNYLGAYSKEGQLNRGQGREEDQDEQDPEGELDQAEKQDSTLDINELERKETEGELRANAANAAKQRGKKKRKIPAERKEDLRPFPLNQNFHSESVLSEELREIIYLKIVEDKMTVRSVSSELGVTMERVGAVVRMKQMERDWLRKGKPLAVPYSRAVLAMLPQTPYIDPSVRRQPEKGRDGKPKKDPVHESINDLPVHPRTTQQIFYPVAESRVFTRADAGKAFHPQLRSADERIPHPELIAIEKLKATSSTPDVQKYQQELIEKEQAQALEKTYAQKEWERRNVKVYAGQRYDFKFQDVSVDSVGKTGRSRSGVGWRYGNPHEDRKPNQVKIPTSVG